MKAFFASLCSGLLTIFVSSYALANQTKEQICPADMEEIELDVKKVLLQNGDASCNVAAQQWSGKEEDLKLPTSVYLELHKIPFHVPLSCPDVATVSIKYSLILDPIMDKRGFKNLTCVPELF